MTYSPRTWANGNTWDATAANDWETRVGNADSENLKLSVVTAKGDLLAATASAAVTRVGIGTDGQILVADSTASTGVRWVSADTLLVTTNLQTGTAYTLVLSDAGKAVHRSNASANTLSIPTNASVAFPIGTVIEVVQFGTGTTTINAVTPGTTSIRSRGSVVALAGQYGVASLRKTATDEWLLAGDLA